MKNYAMSLKEVVKVTIKKANRNKKKIERKIGKLIKKFESSSGLKVTYIEQLIGDKIKVVVSFKH